MQLTGPGLIIKPNDDVRMGLKLSAAKTVLVERNARPPTDLLIVANYYETLFSARLSINLNFTMLSDFI